jgi:hypothetical protein
MSIPPYALLLWSAPIYHEAQARGGGGGRTAAESRLRCRCDARIIRRAAASKNARFSQGLQPSARQAKRQRSAETVNAEDD